VRYYNPKRQAETTITGRPTAATEVYINDVLSSVDQLKVGERVSVVGWAQGEADHREVVASKVYVTRGQTVRRGAPPASQPASAPARG